MSSRPEIVLTVTNDLSYDQRMERICGSLAAAGYKVTLVGRELPKSLPLDKKTYDQVRLKCRYHQGKLFYAEFNWRLYRYLLKHTLRSDPATTALCAIDLDTILPVLAVSKKRRLPRVYDAHEIFTEMVEVKRRALVSAIWNRIERKTVPQFTVGYTVNDFIAGEFKRRYGVEYGVVRNMPLRSASSDEKALAGLQLPDKFFLYQGAVNEGRSFETLIPAMKHVNAELVIVGTGNFINKAKALVTANGLETKVIFTGPLPPAALRALTPKAFAGVTVFESFGMNQYYSLANRFFDYVQAGIPQVCVNYPEYKALNDQHRVALMIDDVSPETIEAAMNKLLVSDVLHAALRSNCIAAAEAFCWEKESQKLINTWRMVMPITENA